MEGIMEAIMVGIMVGIIGTIIMEITGITEITGTMETIGVIGITTAGGMTTIIPGGATTAGGATAAGISGTTGAAGTIPGMTGTGLAQRACGDGELNPSITTIPSTITLTPHRQHATARIGETTQDTTTTPIITIFLQTIPASNMNMTNLHPAR